MRRLEIELQGFFEVFESLVFRFALAGYVDFEALRDIPVPFAPDSRRERSLHTCIPSQ